MSSSITIIWMTALLFGLSHSLLAANACRAWAARRGVTPTAYRLLYSVLATILTALWLWLIHSLPDAPLYVFQGLSALPFYAIQIIGLTIILLSFRAFDAAVFLGLKPMPVSGEPFVESGIYRYIRHPMYTGFMALLLASPVHSMNSLHFSLAVSAYFIIGSIFEERRMQGEHPDYAVYRKRVAAFLPIRALFHRRAASQ
ncbi:MAG: NnrU family protein [Mariprofundaceae bacterium]|nr:NnrU family protein [Mariprofundaceae bacterium]